jgi:cell division protein FtsZ
MINIKMQPKQVNKLSPRIAVIGVGGAGGNAVQNMITSNLDGCEFIVCNTDAQALENSPCPNRVQLGTHVTGGLGAGSKPEIGKAAAEESLEDVMKFLEGANMAFVTAGMGGGTGTGAAPVIAKACRERGILTVGVVTKPFHFEGSHRMRMAEAGIKEMQDYVDTLIVIPNQNLFRVANEKVGFAEAFRMVDGVLQSGVRGVTDLMVRPGLINLDFADIRTAMMEMGKAMMGTGEAVGDKRAVQAAEAAINNPLLDDISMKGALGVIINVTGGYDMTLFEVDEACNRIRDEVDPDANIIFGATFDESMEGTMRVSIVATGIEKEADQKRRSGGAAVKTDARAKPALERTQPRTEQPVQQSPVYIPAPTARAFTAPPALTSQQSMAARTAPQSAIRQPADTLTSLQTFAQTQPAAAQPAPVAKAADAEMEEMFDEFTSTQERPQEADQTQNSIMRGSRYRDSFIPPRPVDPEQEEAVAPVGAPRAMGFPGVQPRGSSPAHTAPLALNLNPPKVGQGQAQRKTPSLFERITGTMHNVQQRMGLGEAGDDYNPAAETPTQRSAPTNQSVPARPAQGSLNIDAPAARPRTAADEELDIPAFLRRQAN